MKVVSTIKTHPDMGCEEDQPKQIEVRSHWNHPEKVHLVINEKTITVIAAELKRAIDNASNHR